MKQIAVRTSKRYQERLCACG